MQLRKSKIHYICTKYLVLNTIIDISVTNESHAVYAKEIADMIEDAAKKRGTGIAKRKAEYIVEKMTKKMAIIALDGNKVAGFCYIESWGHGKYVANSGLIVNESHRGIGLSKQIKQKAFDLSQELFPDAKLFGLTTSLPVMKINSNLGYRPVTFSELTDDEAFWKGCQSCVNYDILTRTDKKHCLCTGMLYDPNEKNNKSQSTDNNNKEEVL
ncbi:MAG: putative GNAT family N-acyltransferase [Saprospiraceae bacterium]